MDYYKIQVQRCLNQIYSRNLNRILWKFKNFKHLLGNVNFSIEFFLTFIMFLLQEYNDLQVNETSAR